MQNEYRFVLTEPEETGTRIDRFLADRIDSLTRSHIQKLIEECAVSVNGSGTKANYKLRTGDTVEVRIPEASDSEILPEEIPLTIVYEDSDLLVVNKPRGMVVHPAHGHTSGTLVNALLHHCEDQLSGINGVKRPGIVHRIDKDTSGLLVVCKSDAAHNGLAAQLKEHSITRVYRAIVKGVLREDGTVDAPIGRHPVDRKRMAVRKTGPAKEAVTHYHILEVFSNYTFVECRLETGRTHQIRVHMNSLGHPILGDPVYGNKDPRFPHLAGQMLHAGVLGFVHPISGVYMEFEAPLPDDFSEVLERLRKNAR